ncbi:MAG: hypothetical protein HYZ74_02550 [Elusimicrobia bacterium]|nr:hypothetical protein [Elusimicrobiota bacterium]
MDSLARKKRPNLSLGQLFVCGSGINRPLDLSLRTLQVLASCDSIIYGHGDIKQTRGILDRFCPGVPVRELNHSPARGSGDSISAACALLEAEIRQGKKVAYLTHGHPLLFSEAQDVLDYCRRRGYTTTVVPALSSVDALLEAAARLDPAFLRRGFSVHHATPLSEGRATFNPRVAAFVLDIWDTLATDRFHKFCRALVESYPATHAVHLLHSTSGGGEVVSTLEVRRFSSARDMIAEEHSLVIASVPARKTA